MQIKDVINQAKLKKIKATSVRQHHVKHQKSRQKGSFLYRRRQQLKLNLTQLSQITGIDQITLKRWETHGITPDDKINQIKKYAQALHLNLSKLVNQILN